MLARYMLSSCVLVSFGPSVCLSQAGVVSKPVDESIWVWRGSFLPAIPPCVLRKFGYLKNYGTSLWDFVRCYVGPVAVGVQEQAEDILV